VGNQAPALDQVVVAAHVRHPDGSSSDHRGVLVHVAEHAYLAVVDVDIAPGSGRYSMLAQLQYEAQAAGNDTYQCEFDVN
jgi:hypothetical protein